jgi:Mg/Co/Ni transporter MgtE
MDLRLLEANRDIVYLTTRQILRRINRETFTKVDKDLNRSISYITIEEIIEKINEEF